MKFTEPVVLSKLVLNSVAEMLLFSLLKIKKNSFTVGALWAKKNYSYNYDNRHNQ